MMCDSLEMFITNVEKEGVFLKLWGQIDKKAALDVEMALYKAYSMYEEGKHLLCPPNIQVGVLCAAKYIDEKYYRARITNDDTRCHGTVEVNFIDFGNRDNVPISNLRSLDCFNATFITLPPLALPFILAGVVCSGGEWNDLTLEHISRQIRYMEVSYTVVSAHLGYNIIKIYLINNDLACHLIRNNLMEPISLERQETILSSMIPRSPTMLPPPDQSLLQYKSYSLEPSSQHEVYVSYITDGPCHFSVQLKKSEAVLAQLMREINAIPLKPFDEIPIPGTVCLAKCMEDSHICRAVITSEIDNHYKLFYVDFGNTEIVPPDNIYQMPFKYIIPKIMAIRLSLNGIEKSTVTLEMQCAFKQFVDNRLLMMEVYPAPKKMALPKCRMWDPQTNIDVIDILNRAAQKAFPQVLLPQKGFTREVKVTYVLSCNKFYVHLKSNEQQLNELMAALQDYCNSEAPPLENPEVNLPCCAQFGYDEQWYRSSITSLTEDTAKVKYIDYGNEEDVATQCLKTIKGSFLTCLRPQALECCLNGYQNMADDIERDNKLEELILEQDFIMKVIDMIDKKALVDLIDSNGSSVTALLMDAMINQPRVVSNSNSEDNTKTYASGNNERSNNDEGLRSQNNRSQNRMDNVEEWRQNSRRVNESESWRQSNRNEREWHDNTSNESFSRGRRNNEGRRTSPSTQNSYNHWNSTNQERSYNNRNSYHDNQEDSYNQNNQSEWQFKEDNRSRSKNTKYNTESYGNKENRNQSRNSNSNQTDGFQVENLEFQGVKKKSKNNSNESENGEWGHKKNMHYGTDYNEKKHDYAGKKNDYAERKSYRERNTLDSDGSYKKGRQDRKPKYDDGGYKKRSYSKDNDFRSNDNAKSEGRNFNNRNGYSQSSYNEPKTISDPAPSDAAFTSPDVSGWNKVTLSWFHNPCSFFCQLLDSQQSLREMMEEIQETYKDIPSSTCVVGAPVIALFPEDNVCYRARVLTSSIGQHKVYYVDFGNISTVHKVWPIDMKFMNLPMQAIPCGLGGIQSVGDEWPAHDAFAKYLQKDYLDCEFLGFEGDRYMVNLISNNQDIKQQLIEDNLARAIELVLPPVEFDITFMVGLQFRAMINYVNDLSDFGISLENGIPLLCSAHNLANASEKFEAELKSKEGQISIIYCHNVIEDRLEVTLYDHEGSKLNILSPDSEGVLETVETVCPYRLIQSKIHGCVSHVDDTCVTIQPTECASQLEELLNEMYEHYNALTEESAIIPQENVMYAVLSGDGNWRRGWVNSLDDEKVEEGQVTVMYVDCGNTEDVTFSSIRELDPKFYSWNKMAVGVHVQVPTTDLLGKNITAEVYYNDDRSLEGVILEVDGEVLPEVAAQTPIDAINQEFNTSCQITESLPVEECSLNTSGIVSNEEQSLSNNLGNAQELPSQQNAESMEEGTAVIVSHIDSPSDFYVQLLDTQDDISMLQTKLQETIEEMSILESASVGGLCAAPYSIDQMWYRSQILDADEDITTVRFIDYGNTDVIDNATTKIKTLPADLLSLEEYATRCRLKIKPLEEEWSKASIDKFEEMVYAENVRMQFINQDEKANYVELTSDGRNVKDVMIAENLALLDEGPALDPELKGYISHMNSPSEFWVQLDGWCAQLEWIAEQLSNAASFPDLEDFTPGSLCAAMFPDDGMWYRARILSNTVAGLEVLFLDYGNSCVCSNLKQLPEHLVMAPPLALKCSLQKPEGLFSWSAEAAQKFTDLSADGQTPFMVKKLTTGETSIVELYVNDETVSSKLLPITDTVNIRDIQSLDSFAVSKEEVPSEERYGLEKIPGYEYNQEALEKFTEINNEGNTRFEAEFLPGNIVRLYVNRNDIRNEILPILKAKSSQTFDVVPELSNVEDLSHMNTQEVNESITEVPVMLDENIEQAIINEDLSEGNENLNQAENLENATVQMDDIQEVPSEMIDESTEMASEICHSLICELVNEATQELSEVCNNELPNIQTERSTSDNNTHDFSSRVDIDACEEKNDGSTLSEYDSLVNTQSNEIAANIQIETSPKDVETVDITDNCDIEEEQPCLQVVSEDSEVLDVQLHEIDEGTCSNTKEPSQELEAPNQVCDSQHPSELDVISETIGSLQMKESDEDMKEIVQDCDTQNSSDLDKESHEVLNSDETDEIRSTDEETPKIWNILQAKEIFDTGNGCNNHGSENSEERLIEECSDKPESLQETEKSVGISDITDVDKTTQKLEYTEKIMTSFSAPTVSEKQMPPKLSPSKVTLLHENSSTNESSDD